eukprot:s127_g16.t1
MPLNRGFRPNPIETLFQRFGQTPQSWSTLLEVMKMLPEENNNYKLMTDSFKRESCSQRIQAATAQVVQFLLNLQCSDVQAKRKVLECFLSWIKYTNLQANEIAQNPFIPECFKYVVEGGELSETATDIIIEVLRMCSQDFSVYQPVIQVILSQLGGLRTKFEALLGRGAEAALDADQDGLLQICRIYVETGECLVPIIMQQSSESEVVLILQVILRCTDLPSQEICAIPLEFWHRLANEVCRHPENDVKIDQFQGVYKELLSISIRRCTLNATQDPFLADDEVAASRQRFLGLVEDCLEILTPNTALEHVLQSLLEGQRQGVTVQEAHFFVLALVGSRAEVREGSVLWQLIQGLPPLISSPVPADSMEGALLHFTKKTAIELLGHLWQWVKTRPDFLRSSLEMVSQLLLNQDTLGFCSTGSAKQPGTPGRAHEASAAGGIYGLQGHLPWRQAPPAGFSASVDPVVRGDLSQRDTYRTGAILAQVGTQPIRMHLFIVDGVGSVVASLTQERAEVELHRSADSDGDEADDGADENEDKFRSGLEQLVTPLMNGLNSERERPAALVGLAIFILYDAYDLTFLMLGIPGPSKIFQKE